MFAKLFYCIKRTMASAFADLFHTEFALDILSQIDYLTQDKLKEDKVTFDPTFCFSANSEKIEEQCNVETRSETTKVCKFKRY